MAEVAKPEPTKDNATPKVAKPDKPDEDAYKKELAAAEKALEVARARVAAAKSKLDVVQGGSKDSPQSQKLAGLRSEQAEIRKKHLVHKDARSKNQEQIKKLDEKLKSLINENKNARGRVPYKSENDIEREVDRLQKEVDTGKMKLVDEKKALSDISGLHRAKKSFVVFAQQQKAIDDVKAEISDLKKGGDNPEVKALNDRYDDIQKQLNEFNSERDSAYKNISGLRDERTKASNEQNEAYTKVKEIKDSFHQARRAWQNYDYELRKQRREKQASERAAYESGKRREVAERKLEEASSPAYLDEILTAENLIRHFDPSAAPVKEAPAASKFAASAGRTVEEGTFKGMKVVKKEEEDYFGGSGGKKKKGKKTPTTTSGPEKFQLSFDVIEQLARIGIDPPVSKDHVPIVVGKLQEKVEFWKGDQKRKTDENVAKAKKEIEKLEAESSPSAPANATAGAKDTHRKPAAANDGLNGKVNAEAELAQEEDAVADATAELEKAKIEDEE